MKQKQQQQPIINKSILWHCKIDFVIAKLHFRQYNMHTYPWRDSWIHSMWIHLQMHFDILIWCTNAQISNSITIFFFCFFLCWVRMHVHVIFFNFAISNYRRHSIERMPFGFVAFLPSIKLITWRKFLLSSFIFSFLRCRCEFRIVWLHYCLYTYWLCVFSIEF